MNITGGSYVMGLGPGLVVVKRNNRSIEVAHRSTKGRRKVRVLLPHASNFTQRLGSSANFLVPPGSRE